MTAARNTDPLDRQTGLTPEQRVLRAKVAAHTRWAKTPDRTAATAAARAAAADRWEKMVDPAITDPAERAKAAQNLKHAHAMRMALASSKARAARRAVA